MPRKQQTEIKPIKRGLAKGKRWKIPPEAVDAILESCDPDDLTGPDGVIQSLIGALVSRVMQAEMSHHLGYERGEAPEPDQDNRRNGKSSKTLRTGHGAVAVDVPRDRDGSYEPKIVPKHERRFDGFDDKIISMYARGMTTREIQAHLAELYSVDVSPTLVSQVTDAVVDELRAWQTRPLDRVYLVVYVDALMVKIRDKAGVRNKAVHLVVGVRTDGTKDVLGMWIQVSEGAKFWLTILSELRQRGVEDILVLCADGLTGLSEAVEASFPQAIFQTCIVHMVRSSVRFVPWKDRRAVCADLRAIYTAENEEAASAALDAFEATWGERFPMVAPAWRRRWSEVTPFLAFPAEIRRAIYTTNAIEALNRQLRKVLKTRGHLPNDDAALKLLFLAIRNASKKWGGCDRRWSKALLQFAIHFEERIPTQ